MPIFVVRTRWNTASARSLKIHCRPCGQFYEIRYGTKKCELKLVEEQKMITQSTFLCADDNNLSTIIGISGRAYRAMRLVELFYSDIIYDICSF
jgi:hypothetical protein